MYAIDLFSGCGGLSLGLKGAGFSVVAAVEIDRKAQQTYRLNHPDVRLYAEDIRKLDPVLMLQDAKLEVGELDLLAGCPPCQGFSRLRTKNKMTSVSDDRNDLVEDFLRFIDVMKPKTVMLENVPALAKDARFLNMRCKLHALGYQTVVNVLDAADYSVPQRRKRLIMLASRVHAPAVAEKAKKRITVRRALKGLVEPGQGGDKLHGLGENRSKKVRDIIALIPTDGGSRSDLPTKYQLDCHKRSDGFSDVYGRLAWDDVSPTITSGCSNPSKGRFLHPVQNRTISLREAAILQGFPRSYKFDVTHGKESIALMIGNALPPPFITAHANALRVGLMPEQA
ncbi:MAG: DNA cytosine methyltransferase [Stenotrophomonas nitritireducens]|uniref:DNA cytosine methyltransferase n=1 Tax=Stenotrophomonas nitritireducens TaxID=83617 RepID=UPI001AC6101D|nr:DNA cytosine methyltransferase [Stenotrophomonas nitritireducens]MBN8769496.1 DNA cytosine methyltransferase [Stenotrophomonas sp.]MBN8794008.1 DNA cytosine methyltransferase [Stenotrophomonas nitritireducens]